MSAAERAQPTAAVFKRGYLKKLKTMKKKYFVLRRESPENSARLEYYDSEKKWRSHGQPKKLIPLNSCFNITRRLDTRQKHVIAMYTRDECLCVVAEDEETLTDWLSALLELLHPGSIQENLPHPRREYCSRSLSLFLNPHYQLTTNYSIMITNNNNNAFLI